MFVPSTRAISGSWGKYFLLSDLHVATLGSILDSQLSWESGKFQLARWSHRVALFSGLDQPPPTHPQLSFFCKYCAVSPPQQSMCGVPPPSICFLSMLCSVPTPFVPLIKKVCAMSPPSSTCNSVPHLALSWILSKVENLASSSLQDEATDCLFLVSYLAPVWLSI